MGTRAGIVTTLTAVSLVTSCSSGGGETAGAETTTTAGPSATSGLPGSPTGPPTPGSGPPSPAPTGTSATLSSPSTAELPSEVDAYADGFVWAWGHGDRAGASRYATDNAVSDLFGYDDRGGTTWVRQSAVEHDTRTQVLYTKDAGPALYVLVDTEAAEDGEPDAVVGANVEWPNSERGGHNWNAYDPYAPNITGLPPTVGAYCDELVRAWARDDRTRADDYATRVALEKLFNDEDGVDGSGWSRSSTGPTWAMYTHPDGSRLTLYVDPARVAGGFGDAVSAVVFS